MSHARVATIALDDAKAVAQALAQNDADLIEVRLDALWHDVPTPDDATLDLVTILEATEVPLLATLRPKRQGGSFDGPEDARINLLMAAAQAGFSAVDIEDDHEQVGQVVQAFRDHADIVLSDHRFIEAPGRETGLLHLLSQMDLKGRYDKLAFPCDQYADRLRALELAHSHAHRGGHPAIAPIGTNAAFRALLPLAGNHATYGSAAGSPPAISGQPTMADIEATWARWGLTHDDLPGDAEAGWYAVIGDPVDHSDSPRIHNAMLRHAGRKERYGALQAPDSLPIMRLVMTVATRIGLRGGSITMPLKQHAAAVTVGDDVAKATGAVNCFRVVAQGIRGVHGTNTDATAMGRLLQGHKTVAVLGAGGAARAAVWAAKHNDAHVTVIARDTAKAAPLADMGATIVDWNDRHGVHADAWVQCTPLGAGDAAPLDAIAGDHLIELVYKGGNTPLEAMAKDAGMGVTSGQDFLIEQALDAYRFWTGQDADRAVMESAR